MGLINLDPDVMDDQLIKPEVPVDDRVNGNRWQITSSTHAFPGISIRKYQNLIMESYANAEIGVAAGTVNAYGLSNPHIIHELLLITQGKLHYSCRRPLWDTRPTRPPTHFSCFNNSNPPWMHH